VRKDVQTKTEQMEKSVRVAEREYSKKMAELNRGFEVDVVCATNLHICSCSGTRQLAIRSQEWRAG
jgi:hypothetical protein